MTDFLFHNLIPGTLKLLLFICVGVFTGCLLEHSGLGKKLSVLGRPFSRWSKLPPSCASAFAMAFVSPRAANAMLAGAATDGQISRNQMICGAIANTFPNTFLHLRTMMFVVVPLLGISGLAYIGFQILSGLCCTLIIVLYARFKFRSNAENTSGGNPIVKPPLSKKDILNKAWTRTKKIMRRVFMITVPLYVVIGFIDHLGIFQALSSRMPETFNKAIAPAAISVLAAHMSSIMNAASAASSLLKSGTLSQMDVFITLLAGYILSVPMRMTRHSIPSALGIFPGKSGFQIVFIQQGLRLALAVVLLTGLISWRLK